MQSKIKCLKRYATIKSCGHHSHDCWEIILLCTGSNIYTVGQEEFTLRQGDILVVPPGSVHGAESEEGFTDMFIRATELRFPGALQVKDQEGDVQALMNILHRITMQKEYHYEEIAEKLLESICEYITRYSGQRYQYEFVIQLKNHIYSNLADPDFRIADAVKELGYTADYVRKCFVKEIGSTPLEYLTMLRLQQARKLLTQEAYLSIEEVARNCGYHDSFYFSRQFKKKFGEAPRDYRQNRQ